MTALLQRFRDARDQTIDRLFEKLEARLDDWTYKRDGYTKVVYPSGAIAYEKILSYRPPIDFHKVSWRRRPLFSKRGGDARFGRPGFPVLCRCSSPYFLTVASLTCPTLPT